MGKIKTIRVLNQGDMFTYQVDLNLSEIPEWLKGIHGVTGWEYEKDEGFGMGTVYVYTA